MNPNTKQRRLYIVTGLASLGAIVLLLTESIVGSCISVAFVSVVAPIITMWLFQKPVMKPESNHFRHSAKFGVLTGLIGATLYTIASNIEYYLLGDREKTATSLGLPIPLLNIDLILRGLFADVIIWLIMVAVSVFVAYLADKLFVKSSRA